MDPFTLFLQSPANMALFGANVVLSLMCFQNAALTEKLLFDVARMRRDKEWYRAVSSAFIHGDPFHLLMNMIALFFFGPILELQLGVLSFLAIYFGSLAAASGWTWMEHFRDMNYKALGASGAISGVTSAAAMFYPFATIYAFFAVPMPLIVFALLYIVWSAWASSSGRADGIGHAAHLGGALGGIAIVCIFYPWALQELIDQLMLRLRGFA
jgi:membrane associated rhomboid family serine protease